MRLRECTLNHAVRPPSPGAIAAVQSATRSPTKTVALEAMRSLPLSPQNKEPAFVKRCKSRLCLAASAACVALLVLAVALTLQYTSTRSHQGFSTCDTKPCNSYAVMLSSTINTDQNPCDNFYNYVCDGWRGQSSVPKNHMKNFLDDLGKTLDDYVPRHHQTAIDKAAGFYQSCRRVANSVDGELANFRRIFNECGIEWPRVSQQPDVLRSLVRLYRVLAVQNLLNIQREDHGGTSVLALSTGPTAYRLHFRAKLIKNYGKYAEYYQRFQQLFKVPDTTDEELLKYAQHVEIEDHVYSGLLNYTKQFYDWHPQSLQQLAALTKEQIPYERWAQVVTSELGISPDAPVRIAPEDYDYLKAFSQLFETVGERYLHHQVGWMALQTIAPFINRESLNIYVGDSGNATAINFYMCLPLSEVLLGWALYARYASSKLDVKTAKDIEDIIDNVAAAAALKLNIPGPIAHDGDELKGTLHDQLMQYPTRFQDLTHLDGIFSNISDMGPDLAINWINAVDGRARTNATMWKSQEIMFASQIWDAFSYTLYNDYSKTFLVPPSALMLPLYKFDLCTNVKYAAFGLLVATAALDTLQYSAEGILKTGCLGEPSSSDLMLLYRAASLQVAWEAYRNASVGKPDVRLRHLATLTANHIFFIVSCYILCGQDGDHEPMRACNEPLRHHPNFSNVFACPEGSTMNPRKKCQLF